MAGVGGVGVLVKETGEEQQNRAVATGRDGDPATRGSRSVISESFWVLQT